MKSFLISFFAVFFLAVLTLAGSSKAQDSSCSNPSSLNLDAIARCLADIQKAYDMSVKATQPLESELNRMQSQINGIKKRVSAIEDDLLAKEKSINESYKNLAKQEEILNRTIRDFYIKSYYNSPILAFLSQASASQITKVLTYQKAATDQDKVIITNIALSISDLEAKKKALKNEQSRLVSVREALDEESAKIGKIVAGAKAYQGTLSGQIAALSAKQQEILTARSGTFTASIGDSELADDYNASIKGFRESAPSGYFAVFSFGGHTHRKGMSQYGARGRAQSGQDYKAILKAYYNKEPVNKDTGGDINVQGLGSMNFEERYLYGIAEMPSTWNSEALKAQAVAARTYALRYKQNGQSICITEACQVFSSSKADNPPQAWKDAVNNTRGQVLEDVVTYYASTHGGFASPIGWDTTDGTGGGNFIDKSYDKLGGSPWLYKAWYTQGYSPSSNKCGRENPYLSSEELADIINAARFRDDRVTPITTSCWGGNPYSHEELREKSNGPSFVSSVTVSQGNGTTNEVIFQTNIGEIRLSGSDFKTAFNIRAPGYLSIPQSGFAFYNIEKK
ncbi:MAG: SpoIID/LytB domain-containing protein [Patescibacteria group bacterium]